MHPRLPTSRKWTAFPTELKIQIQSVFKETFKDHIKGGTVVSEGRIYPGEILVMIGYQPGSGLKQANFEVSVAYKKDKDNVLKMINLAVDAAGSLFEQYFTLADDSSFPRVWLDVDFEGREIFIQYTTTNSKLEAEADKLLGEFATEGLTQGEWDAAEDMDPEQIKAKLGLDDDDPDDDGRTH